jgi:transposase InsO family protein
MPWKETDKMEQRIEFALRALRTGNFRELCHEYGISAKTGYKWRERFLRYGWEGMAEESRRPHGHADQLGEAVVCEMVRLKQAHRHWGPRKIQALYRRQHGGEVPSESSFKRVLERAGLTTKRRIRRAEQGGRLATGRKAEKPNDIWTVDFKGWWKDPQGLRVEPLTVRDEHSRMLLEMKILADSCGQTVRACFEQLFRQHGLPGAIRSDNGAPFASGALLGLSRLSAWWLALGIDLERNRPGCPQDNGAHERLHRDVRIELEAGRVGRDQADFDQWRQEYNQERPHEALGMKTPAEVYQRSERTYAGTPEDLEYGGSQTRRVNKRTGQICYRAQPLFITTALGGWSVGLKAQQNGLVEVWFSQLLLGHIDPETCSFLAARPGSEEAGQEEDKPCNL